MKESPVSTVESKSKVDHVARIILIANTCLMIALCLWYSIAYRDSISSYKQVFWKHFLLELDSVSLTTDEMNLVDVDRFTENLFPLFSSSIVLLGIFFYVFYLNPIFSFWFSCITMLSIILFNALNPKTVEHIATNVINLVIWFVCIVILLIYRKNHPKVAFFFKNTLFMFYRIKWISVLYIASVMANVILFVFLAFSLHGLATFFNRSETSWAYFFQLNYIRFSEEWLMTTVSVFLQMMTTTLVYARLYPQTGTSSISGAFKRSWRLHFGAAVHFASLIAFANVAFKIGFKSMGVNFQTVAKIFYTVAIELTTRITAIYIALYNKSIGGAIASFTSLLKRTPKSLISVTGLTMLIIATPVKLMAVVYCILLDLLRRDTEGSLDLFTESLALVGTFLADLLVPVCVALFILYKSDKHCVQHLPSYDRLILPLKKETNAADSP